MDCAATSSITDFISSFFKRAPAKLRIALLGLRDAGRTTFLYRLKLGEAITVVPTMGFNVEDVKYRNTKFTIWDVGAGWDRVRLLYRHWFADLDALLFFVDSHDAARINEAKHELRTWLKDVDVFYGVPILVFANKQDLCGCMSDDEVRERMELSKIGSVPVTCLGGSGLTGQGVHKALDWILEVQTYRPPSRAESEDVQYGGLVPEDWRAVEDERDDQFIAKLQSCELDSWNHRTHLRTAWVYLKRHGRREGENLILKGIKHYLSSRSMRSQNMLFNETLTYFWVHMVHYAMEMTDNPKCDFKTFLELNPHLCNQDLCLKYYTRELLFGNPEARENLILPDRKPLPSLITCVSKPVCATETVPHSGVVTDSEFLWMFEQGTLKKWSHECLLRVVWVYLRRLGHYKAVNVIMENIKRQEGKQHFHFTITWFWIHMVAWVSEMDKDSDTFQEFVSGKAYAQKVFCELLIDKMTYLQYYREETIFSSEAQNRFVVPDKRQLPNVTL